MNVHNLIKERKKNEFKCDNCDKAYGDNKQLKRHFKSVHEGWKHYCNLCGKSFSYVESLKRHRDGHNQKFECNACPKVYPIKDCLSRHVKNCHPDLRNTDSNSQNFLEPNISKIEEDNTTFQRGSWIVQLERINVSKYKLR